MATYEEYEKDQLAKAQAQAAAYEQERRKQADEAKKQATTQYTQSVEDTHASYRDVYDANAVAELVARREAAEAIANTNMANSGLNNTQQTAISLQRSRADAATTEARQQAVDAIMRELDSVRAQYDSQANADILTFRQNAETSARENAAAMYNADVEAAQKEAEREYELKLKGLTADEDGNGQSTEGDDSEPQSLIGTSNGISGTKGGYGSLTQDSYRAKNGKVYDGFDAGKMRVYDFCFRMWHQCLWGDINTTEGLNKAMNALNQYLYAQLLAGNLADADAAEEVREHVINAVDYDFTW